MEQRCRDYISMQISKIIQIIQNTTETLDVSVSFSLKKTLLFEHMEYAEVFEVLFWVRGENFN